MVSTVLGQGLVDDGLLVGHVVLCHRDITTQDKDNTQLSDTPKHCYKTELLCDLRPRAKYSTA